MTEDEFAEKLRGYTLDDFSEGDDPCWDLLLYSRLYPGLYEQFSEVLIDVAKSLMTTQQLSFLPRGIRLRILVLLYDSAIRVSELLDLDVRSVNLNAEIPYIRVFGKGEKERIVSITDKTAEHIRAYLKLWCIKKTGVTHTWRMRKLSQNAKKGMDEVEHPFL